MIFASVPTIIPEVRRSPTLEGPEKLLRDVLSRGPRRTSPQHLLGGMLL